MSAPKVSVLFPVYNESQDHLRPAIESILSQTHENLEVLVLLDNPQYRHLDLLNQYAEKDPRIVLHVNEQNMGLARSLNNGIEMCTGEYICRMDADDISFPDRVESQLQYLLDNGYDHVGGLIEAIDESDKSLYFIDRLPATPKKVNKALRNNNCVMHPTWLGKVEVFDQRYRLLPLCEDYDFLLRASLAGRKIGNLQKVVVRYRMTSQSLTRSNLFENYLIQRYLTDEYSASRIANQEKILQYVKENNSQEKGLLYSRANSYFNDGLALLRGKKFVQGASLMIKAATTSKEYRDKMKRMFVALL